MKKTLLMLAACMVLFASCKPDKEETTILNVYPQHHEVAKNLVNMKVYYKRNTLDKPADNVYDDSTTCINRDTAVLAIFTNMPKGNYYVYGKGYDTLVKQEVVSGAPYTLTQIAPQDMVLAVSER